MSAAAASKMEYRHLGRSGLKVSVLSLGGWITYGGQVGDDAAEACLKVAYENGINFFDNAEVYASGKSEISMGKAIKKFGWPRSSYVISTKIYWGGPTVNERGLSRKHIIEGTKAAIDRLQLDYVDLVFAHRPDDTTPMEEIVRAFNWVIEKGWAFYWGTSEWTAEQLTDAHRIADRLGLIGPLMEQPQYNMFHRERFEKEYANLYEKQGLGTTIWSPLASGVLTGKYNDSIPADSRLAYDGDAVVKMLRDRLQTEDGVSRIQKVRALEPIAKKLDCSLAQLAIAWCVKNPNVSTVITGASRPSQVEENIKALDVVPKLTAEVMEEIEAILQNKPKLDPRRF
ncbi:NADP-dependent oxidoreductase domain-containing protein [Zopfochytrium polystomum]|nr:NADP-dependent oxidoreductase domain-containing protein [Zopfochytrium polystomum]